MTMTNIFLSYGRGDDEPFVERLSRALKARGLDVWFDRESMPSRSLTFHQEIRDAIATCVRLVLIVGPHAVASEYVQQEWQFALEADKVVTPILRVGDYPLVPDELKLLHCEDFRDDARFEFHLDNLARQLSEPPPPLGKLIAVPSLPPHYLARTERLKALRDAVRADLDRPVVLTGETARVGMHGMGGIGKSVLAAALVRDRLVREAFPDGIVWIGLGSLPTITELQRRVHRDLGGDGAIATEHEGKTKLKELLADKSVLLVLDDVWRRSDADAFNVLGPRCRALITTRDAGLLTSLGGPHHFVELLTDAEAFHLLSQASGVPRDALPSEAHGIVAECGRLPLAVSLCGSLVRRNMSWSSVLEQLQEARIDRIADRHAVEPQHQSVWQAIHVSVESLQPGEKERFLELGVFPPDQTTPGPAAATLWAHTGSLDAWATAELLTTLAERSLVQMTAPAAATPGPRRFSLHDLIYDYTQRAQSDQRSLHGDLLAAYQKKCPDGWHTGPNDGYFFERLCMHIAEASRAEDLVELLHDLHWLQSKARNRNVYEISSDFEIALDELPREHQDRQGLQQLADALESAAHILTGDAAQLRAQLLARLPPEVSSKVTALLENARKWINGIWIRPKSPFLRSSMASLIRTMEGRAGGFTTKSDEFTVASASDEAVKVWDITRGQIVFHVDFETRPSAALAQISSDGRWLAILSINGQTVLEVWDTKAQSLSWRLIISGEELRLDGGLAIDGHRLFASIQDGTIAVWELSTGKRLPLIGAPHVRESSTLFTNGQLLIVLSSPLEVYDTNTGTMVVAHDFNPFKLHRQGRIKTVAVTPDCSTVAYAHSSGQYVSILDVETGQHSQVGESEVITDTNWPSHLGPYYSLILAIAISPDGQTVVTGSSEGTIGVWDVTLRTKQLSFKIGGATTEITDVQISLDGQTAIVATDRGALVVLDLKQQVARSIQTGGVESFWTVHLLDGGRQALTNSDDGVLRLWDLRHVTNTPSRHTHFRGVTAVAFSPDGRQAVSGSRDGCLKRWDTQSGCALETMQMPIKCKGVAIAADCSRAALAGENQSIDVWRPLHGYLEGSMEASSHDLGCFVLSPTGRWLVAVHYDRSADEEYFQVWDLEAWQKSNIYRMIIKGSMRLSSHAVFIGDDHCLIGGELWNLNTQEVEEQLRTEKLDWWNVARILALSDQEHLFVASGRANREYQLGLLNWKTGELRRTFGIGDVRSNVLAATSDGNLLISGSSRTIRLWDTWTGKLVSTFSFESPILSIATAPHNSLIVIGNQNGEVSFLDIVGREEFLDSDVNCSEAK